MGRKTEEILEEKAFEANRKSYRRVIGHDPYFTLTAEGAKKLLDFLEACASHKYPAVETWEHRKEHVLYEAPEEELQRFFAEDLGFTHGYELPIREMYVILGSAAQKCSKGFEHILFERADLEALVHRPDLLHNIEFRENKKEYEKLMGHKPYFTLTPEGADALLAYLHKERKLSPPHAVETLREFMEETGCVAAYQGLDTDDLMSNKDLYRLLGPASRDLVGNGGGHGQTADLRVLEKLAALHRARA